MPAQVRQPRPPRVRRRARPRCWAVGARCGGFPATLVSNAGLDGMRLVLVSGLGRCGNGRTRLRVVSPFADRCSRRGPHATIERVTGSETDVCVLATVIGAVDHGYRVIVVTDAVCSSSDEGHDAMLKLYRERYSLQIEAVGSEAILSAWSA